MRAGLTAANKSRKEEGYRMKHILAAIALTATAATMPTVASAVMVGQIDCQPRMLRVIHRCRRRRKGRRWPQTIGNPRDSAKETLLV